MLNFKQYLIKKEYVEALIFQSNRLGLCVGIPIKIINTKLVCYQKSDKTTYKSSSSNKLHFHN